ncbi:middle expressed protein 4 [Lactococcus phage 936 group phage Phi17]|nr:middle expressed protein 4 [Lactococcus phage 936 group phage Phi17]
MIVINIMTVLLSIWFLISMFANWYKEEYKESLICLLISVVLWKRMVRKNSMVMLCISPRLAFYISLSAINPLLVILGVLVWLGFKVKGF